MKEAVSVIEKSIGLARIDVEFYEKAIRDRRAIISAARERYKSDIAFQFGQLEGAKKQLAEAERKRDELKEALVILQIEEKPEF